MSVLLKASGLALLASSALAVPAKRSFDTQAWGYGLSYSPYTANSQCKTQDQINQDFSVFAPTGEYGFVRAYGTDCDQTQLIFNACQEYNLLLWAGVYDIFNVQSEVQLIIDAAQGDWSRLATVSVGNEGVNDGTYTVDQVTSAVGQARQQLRNAGYGGPVVTVDTYNQVINNPALCYASDFAAANCHAFFAGVEASDAGPYVISQVEAVSNACGGMNSFISESGWPSQGQTNNQAVPSEQNQQTAIASLRSSFSSNIVLFSAFNDLWKQNNQYTFGAEQWWGIFGYSPNSS